MSGESWLGLTKTLYLTHQSWLSRPSIQHFLIFQNDVCFVTVFTFLFNFFLSGVWQGAWGVDWLSKASSRVTTGTAGT